VLALVVAALWIVGITLDHLFESQTVGGTVGGLIPIADLIAAASVASSLALYWWAGREGQNPRVTLNAGLGYLVFTAFSLGLITHWDHTSSQAPIHSMISWDGILIMMFAAIVPTSPRRMAVAGLLAVSMNPLGMLLARAEGIWQFDSVSSAFNMHFPDYLLVGVAAIISHVVTQLGRQVGKARELGSYELTEALGRGGMGEVWRARHRMLARDAAIKLIQPELLAGGSGRKADQVQRRFEQEARITASLRSPHTVELYDFGVTEDGVFYYVMELLSGIDLGTLVTRFGPQPAARAVHILRQTCRSLEEAHGLGMIHRDVKPGNIFICRMGTEYDFAKVLDFGLVKTLNTTDGGLTAEGGLMGTPDYMPPEMALGGGNVGAASDLYGLGCVAYWLLTGKRVFETSGAVAMMLAHVREAPMPLSERAGHEVPAALEQIVMRCLEKDPANRYASAEELDRALAGCSDTGAPWSRESAKKWWLLNAPESVVAADALAGSTLTQQATL
jgi:serine/threonine-protein kinase